MKRRHGDRLSGLPDKVLERILSSLPSAEAVRTSALSRRWRDVYAAVPVVDLVDTKVGRTHLSYDDLKVCFDQQVTGAILCKSPGTPVRAFRLDVFSPPDALLDQWIGTVVSSGAEEIDVKLRYWHYSKRRLCPFGPSKEASADFQTYDLNRFTKTHRCIFGCRTLRRLRLKNWTLELPLSVALSSLETLCLARIMDPDKQLQQLLSNCPQLADLTLQECPSVGKITVASVHLRSFTMICCHHATRIGLRSPCLQSLRYKGGLPRKSLFKVANYPAVMALAIEICEDISTKEQTDVASMR
ncbi:F-box/FBD/LRR-repeat protein At1g16930 [Brachypodium distachyon]|uniref:F-box/FBD/LRR-repeat protein At1g16930 n=1 Tax=Brachypodium distachyon TaxID=15368 RepID=UPI000D0CD180|nr:F-box/FBD/LRR-repeat protein At1g16930 [Brachypodium distachyon]|eukprot:XP_024311864.1 F-box/FBD/LRR-repeat protein At1g16930 [Brachypodium distachyon]